MKQSAAALLTASKTLYRWQCKTDRTANLF